MFRRVRRARGAIPSGAHFRDFAKARILQKAEIVRTGSSWTFTPKGDTRHAPYERENSQTQRVCGSGKHCRHIARPTKYQKKKPRQDQWVPRGQLLLQIMEPCSNGAPFNENYLCKPSPTRRPSVSGRAVHLLNGPWSNSGTQDIQLMDTISVCAMARNRLGLQVQTRNDLSS